MMKGNESRAHQCSSMLTRVPIKGPEHSVPDDPRPDLAEPFSQTGHRGLSAGSGSFLARVCQARTDAIGCIDTEGMAAADEQGFCACVSRATFNSNFVP